MKVAIYPGSFNPWHEGHQDILNKALSVFDKVIIAQGINPGKEPPVSIEGFSCRVSLIASERVDIKYFEGFLHEFIKTLDDPITAVIRGLRNGNDLQYEQNQQYWYEDLGLHIPIVYFITDRRLGHISSSAIRAINGLKTLESK
jgi:pantetheine-phosphate adenylyltransferase